MDLVSMMLINHFLFRKEQNLVRSISVCYCKTKLAHSKEIHTQSDYSPSSVTCNIHIQLGVCLVNHYMIFQWIKSAPMYWMH